VNVDVIKDPKINAALELVNSYAKEKADEVGEMVSRNYGHLKAAVTKGTREAIEKNPWAVFGGAAAALLGIGLLIGLLAGRDRK
jgi:ElaB/YqjD/DUF883 family membrane-anchored ribosome-binding protein